MITLNKINKYCINSGSLFVLLFMAVPSLGGMEATKNATELFAADKSSLVVNCTLPKLKRKGAIQLDCTRSSLNWVKKIVEFYSDQLLLVNKRYERDQTLRKDAAGKDLTVHQIEAKLNGELAEFFSYEKITELFVFPHTQLTLTEANEIISALERLAIPDSIIKKISVYLGNFLHAQRGELSNHIVSDYFRATEDPSLDIDFDYNKPNFKVFLEYARKIVNPPDAYKRKLALNILNESGRHQLVSPIVDAQSWRDLEIFSCTEGKSLAQNICKAKTELGKVFFWRKIATPTSEKKALDKQKQLIQAFQNEQIFSQLEELFEKLKIYEVGICGLWDEHDEHFGSLRFNRPRMPVFSMIPLLNKIPFLEKYERDHAEEVGFQQVAMIWSALFEIGVNIYQLWTFSPKILREKAIAVAQKIDEITSQTAREGAVFKEIFYLKACLQYRLKFVRGYVSVLKEIRIALAKTDNPELHKFSEKLDLENTPKKLQELIQMLETETFSTEILKLPDSPVKQMIRLVNHQPIIMAAAEKLLKCKNDLIPLISIAGEIDANMSIVRLLNDTTNKYCLADFDFESSIPYVSLQDYWNPAITKGAVENSLDIGTPNPNTLVFSGANKAGKSNNTEAIPVGCSLGQGIGIVPARSFRGTPLAAINVFRNIKDDRSKGDSRFQAELKRAEELYKKVQNLKPNEFALTYLDEPYTGTAPFEGAIASYERIRQFGSKPNALTLVTTHFARMQELAKNEPSKFKNYKVVAQLKELDISYTYKLQEGWSDQCIAFELAANLNQDPCFLRACKETVAVEKKPLTKKSLKKIYRTLDPVLVKKAVPVDTTTLNHLLLLTRSSLDNIQEEDGAHHFLSADENRALSDSIKSVTAAQQQMPIATIAKQEEVINPTASYILGCLGHNYSITSNSLAVIVDQFRAALDSPDGHIRAGAAYYLAKVFSELESSDTAYTQMKNQFSKNLLLDVAHRTETDQWVRLASMVLYAKMRLAESAENCDEAVAFFKEVIAQEDENREASTEAHYQAGMLFFEKHDFKNAGMHFQKALANMASGNKKGRMYLYLAQMDDSENKKFDYLSKAIRLITDEKEHKKCALLLGELYTKRNNFQKAVDFEKTFEKILCVSCARIYLQFADMQACEDKKLDNLSKEIHLITDKKEHEKCAHFLRELFAKLNNFQQAIKFLAAAHDGDTQDSYRAEYAKALNQQYAGRAADRHATAAKSYQKVIDAPHADNRLREIARVRLAELYLDGTYGIHQNYTLAKQLLEQVSNTESSLSAAKAHYLLGRISLEALGEQKNLELALDYFTLALRLSSAQGNSSDFLLDSPGEKTYIAARCLPFIAEVMYENMRRIGTYENLQERIIIQDFLKKSTAQEEVPEARAHALWQLAQLSVNGTLGEEDTKKAIEYLNDLEKITAYPRATGRGRMLRAYLSLSEKVPARKANEASHLCTITELDTLTYDSETKAEALLYKYMLTENRMFKKNLLEKAFELNAASELLAAAHCDYYEDNDSYSDRDNKITVREKLKKQREADPKNKLLEYLSYGLMGCFLTRTSTFCQTQDDVTDDLADLKNVEKILTQPNFPDIKLQARAVLTQLYFKLYLNRALSREANTYLEDTLKSAEIVLSEDNHQKLDQQVLDKCALNLGIIYISFPENSTQRSTAGNVLNRLLNSKRRTLQAVAWYYLGLEKIKSSYDYEFLVNAAGQDDNKTIQVLAQKELAGFGYYRFRALKNYKNAVSFFRG